MIDNNKFEGKPWKVLAKEYIFGKVVDTQPATLSKKNEPHYWYFWSHLSSSKEPLSQSRSQRKNSQFWKWMDIMLLSVSCSLFLAVAVCTLKWWMVKLLQKKKSCLINPICFRVRMIKGYMKITEWKHTVESAVHSTLKLYENYSISFLMPK